MEIFEYPKTETLFNRNTTDYCIIEGDYRLQEFLLPATWYVTEKVHGANIRVVWDGKTLDFGTKNEMGTDSLNRKWKGLVPFLQERITEERMFSMFGGREVILFGEGFGAGIQKGGGNYSQVKQFILFDAFVNKYWLEPENLKEVAASLQVAYVPELGMMPLNAIVDLVRKGFDSPLAMRNTGAQILAEGVIARTNPGLMTRYGTRLMFKLKHDDFSRMPIPEQSACGATG